MRVIPVSSKARSMIMKLQKTLILEGFKEESLCVAHLPVFWTWTKQRIPHSVGILDAPSTSILNVKFVLCADIQSCYSLLIFVTRDIPEGCGRPKSSGVPTHTLYQYIYIYQYTCISSPFREFAPLLGRSNTSQHFASPGLVTTFS